MEVDFTKYSTCNSKMLKCFQKTRRDSQINSQIIHSNSTFQRSITILTHTYKLTLRKNGLDILPIQRSELMLRQRHWTFRIRNAYLIISCIDRRPLQHHEPILVFIFNNWRHSDDIRHVLLAKFLLPT